MPNTGCLRSRITMSSFLSFRYSIALLASPCPGKSTLSAFISSSALSVTVGSMPRRLRLFTTEYMFPALYLTIAMFMSILFVLCLGGDSWIFLILTSSSFSTLGIASKLALLSLNENVDSLRYRSTRFCLPDSLPSSYRVSTPDKNDSLSTAFQASIIRGRI